MREILFRGKRVDNGEWVYGYYNNRTNDKEDIHCILEKFPITVSKKVIPETVGQFVCLDKNGERVFDGDIIKAPIYYDAGCYPHTEVKTMVVEIPDFYRVRFDGGIEVIGNIHDNPELVRG